MTFNSSGITIYTECPKKTHSMLSMLCRMTNSLLLKTEPLSGTAWFEHCGASKCLFHMSSINRTCATTLQTGFILCHCRAYIGCAELHTRPNKCGCLVQAGSHLCSEVHRIADTQEIHQGMRHGAAQQQKSAVSKWIGLFP